jgi:hypothetical protein
MMPTSQNSKSSLLNLLLEKQSHISQKELTHRLAALRFENIKIKIVRMFFPVYNQTNI